ncbi:hypothetical protein FC19_GL002076 [Liquorilactobacillus aquaticus DSM 21051]|uniref:Uncharacterized protein n=1 Tax=Liquorilactobacillus aquaticus DSM 21051 TaxID=1423725 RepID=A0A0R2CU53_9LACO|nr:hypothetical protein [Liquorilactobacillus aquaticus]KRM95310.1 hypothetical protein FC19_GL002076 [Liquorilactobacillus aquaticus DSM 21051]
MEKAMLEIVVGQSKITQTTGLFAQSEELKTAFQYIQHTKNAKITHTFSETYIFAATFVLLCSPIALWSEERKIQKTNFI